MQIETHGQQIDVTPALRDYVENRFARLGRHFEHPCQIRVQLGLDKPHHRAEATVTVVKGKKITLHCLAYDEAGEIGEAEHIRFVVEAKPFMEKAGTR